MSVRRRPRSLVEVVSFVVAIVALTGLIASPAHAAWSVTGSGTGASNGRTVTLPTSRTATATGATAVQISWAAPAAPSATPTQYVVRRTAPSAATVCSVTGAVFTCNDVGLGPTTTYTYTIEARIGTAWTSGQSPPLSATTTPQPTYVVTVPAGNRTAGTAFNVTIRATTNGTTTDTAYAGTRTVAFSGPSASPDGTNPTYPATVNFASGIGTASVTLVRAETATLQATDGTRTGSAAVTVGAGPPTTLRFADAACPGGSVIVGNGGSFASHVGTTDSWGNPSAATSFVTLIIVVRSPEIGTLSQALFLLFVGDDQTNGFTYTLPAGIPPDVTLTASGGSFTPASCIVGDT